MKNISITKKLIFLVSLLGSFAFAAWDGNYGNATEPQKDSTGTYLINTENDLAWISKEYQGKNCNINIKLMSDLDMGYKSFIPISAGKGETRYKGTFDGNGHTIKNLFIDSDSLSLINTNYGQNIGLIATLDGTVKNLTIENADIRAAQSIGKIIAGNETPISVGILVGWFPGEVSGKIIGVHTTGVVHTTGSGQAVGGIVGYSEKNVTIEECLSSATLIADGDDVFIGGITGKSKGNITLNSVAYEGKVMLNNGSNGANGGLVGENVSGTLTIENSYFNNQVVSSGIGVGTSVGIALDKEELNTEEVICGLNNGELVNGVCSIQEPWSVGFTSISLNGSDGYKIIFDANGGTFPEGAKNTKIATKGALISADGIHNPEKDNAKFVGWALSANAENPTTDLGFANGTTTIYALWDTVYAIVFDANGSNFPNGNEEQTIYIAKNDPITMNALEDIPNKLCKNKNKETGCKYFVGWSRTEDSTANVTDSLNNSLIKAVENTTFYAIWTEEETYTVTFNAQNRGTTTIDFVEVAKGENVVQPADPTGYTGYEFVGWYNDSLGTTAFDFATSITESIILYAKWDLTTYNITYELNGGTNALANLSSYNIESPIFNLEAPTKEGYKFIGWFYDSEFQHNATQISPNLAKDITLYAKWEQKKYEVIYMGSSVSIGSEIQYKIHGEDLTLLAAGYFQNSNSSYVQNGWATSVDGELAYELGGIYQSNESITLYPHWVQKIEIHVSVKDSTFIYDGNPHSSEILVSGLPEGYTLNASCPNNSISIVGAGTVEAICETSSIIEKRTGKDVSNYFTVSYESGKLTMVPRSTQYGAITISEDETGKSALIDGLSIENTEILTEEIVKEVSFNRNFPVGKMSTIVLPFSIPVQNVVGAKFYGVSLEKETEEWVAYAHPEMDSIKANTPYLVVPSEETLQFNITEPVSLKTSSNTSTLSDDNLWEFKGVYNYKKFETGDSELGYAYGFSAENRDNIKVGQFVKVSSGAFIRPMRAYLIYHPTPVLAKSLNTTATNYQSTSASLQENIDVLIYNEVGDLTSIATLNTKTGSLNLKQGWFDLKGRRLNAKPRTQGTYYHNGMRVIIK